MKLKSTPVVIAAFLALTNMAPAHADTSKEIEELRQEVQRLREEVAKQAQQKNTATNAESPKLADQVEQVSLKQKSSVTLGDIPGSFRLPGSETSIRVYGFAEAHLIHDFKGTAPGDDFSNLPEQPFATEDNPRVNKHTTKLTAQTSRLGFETSTPTTVGAFNTKLEMDFYAYCGSQCNRNRLRLRHAYGEYAGFLIGQTWSTFMDIDTLPETVDFNGPIGSPFSRRGMIRYTYNNPQLAKFTVALEEPTTGARMPNLVARVDKNFDWGTTNVRLLAHEKRDEPTGAVKRGYGIGMTATYKPNSSDVFSAQITRVDSADLEMMYGSAGAAFSKNDDGTDKDLVLDKTLGAVLGWGHVYSDKLRTNLALGWMRSKGDQTAYINKNLLQAHIDFIYTPLKNVDLGAELIYGQRKTFNGERSTLSRFDLMARYSF